MDKIEAFMVMVSALHPPPPKLVTVLDDIHLSCELKMVFCELKMVYYELYMSKSLIARIDSDQ